MSITKRFYKENGSKKICCQAQVYVRGVRLKTRTFKTKREVFDRKVCQGCGFFKQRYSREDK